MTVLIPQVLSHMPQIAEVLGRDHEVVSAAGASEADLLAAIDGADVLVATAMDVSAQVLAAGERLQVVGTPQVGFDRIDVKAATELGIPVLSAAGVSPTTVAEFTVGLMLDLSRRVVRADRDLRATGWSSRKTYAEPDRQLGTELYGATVGVVGVGHIGIALAAICAQGFGCSVLGFDPYVDQAGMAANGIAKRDELIALAAEVDFLVLHLPLTAATRHVVGAEVFAAMKPSAVVVNVARGGVLDEAALITALDEGQIAGAALDVFESEPLPADSPLRTHDAVILTPHIAGVTVENNERRAVAFAERVLTTLSGERPEGLANPAVWPAFLARRRRLLERA